MRPIVLIGHDEWETFGVAPAALAEADTPFIRHLSHTGAELPNLADVSGVVVYGGVMNVDMVDEYPFLGDERTFVRKAVDAGIPYLGTCLGAQMLARALDHPVYQAGVREFGFHPLHPTRAAGSDPLLSVFAEGDQVFHWHEDTFELPEEATLLATGDHVKTQAFRYGEVAWGLQFHVEVDRAEIDMWLEVAGATEVEAWGKTTDQIVHETDRFIESHEERGREVFRRFARLARG
jgi:GMP synthase (glutamine-hydrolysing)